MAAPIWAVDTSSLIIIRSSFTREQQRTVLNGLADLVTASRLGFPREVVAELERYLGPTNPALQWARTHQGTATQFQPSFESRRGAGARSRSAGRRLNFERILEF